MNQTENNVQEKTETLYGQNINAIDAKPMNLKSLKSKPVLLVNIATQCGYTKQLGGLEELYQKYKNKGLQVIGIPSNDFGGQTPEEAVKVKDFCKLNYGVSFPLTEKTKITGADSGTFANWLKTSSADTSPVKWNFEKFLVNKDGKLIKRYKSTVTPDNPELQSDIESVL